MLKFYNYFRWCFFRAIVLNDFVVEIHVTLRYQETRKLHPTV